MNAAGSGPGAGLAEQTFGVSVLPGPLTIAPSTESLQLRQPNGLGGLHTASLSTITAVDARGSLVGWTAAVSLQSVAGLDATQLSRARFCVDPDPPAVVAGNPSEVGAAPPSCGRVGDPLTVFFAPSGGGGGTFSDTGSLRLLVPGGGGPDPVTATLTVAIH